MYRVHEVPSRHNQRSNRGVQSGICNKLNLAGYKLVNSTWNGFNRVTLTLTGRDGRVIPRFIRFRSLGRDIIRQFGEPPGHKIVHSSPKWGVVY